MSEFSFDPKASKGSTFQRLVSGNVGSLAAQSSGSQSGKSRVENGTAGDEQQLASIKTAPLEAAVTNLSRSSATLEHLSAVGAEIALSNVEASKASVRDVDAAAKLARNLSSRIAADGDAASDAQIKGISVSVVERLLG